MELDEKLFNLIFQSGVIPDSWLNGNMKPIYKNKGYKTDPQNCRPITVLSCLGKVFTSILSERLTQYSDKFLVLCENQSGFRKGNLFILHSLFNILKNKKKKLYCAFVDFAKAFDTIWRDGLWHKLLLIMEICLM
jgi:hypothetical protein